MDRGTHLYPIQYFIHDLKSLVFIFHVLNLKNIQLYTTTNYLNINAALKIKEYFQSQYITIFHQRYIRGLNKTYKTLTSGDPSLTIC